jgi:hypothetical protein
MQPLGGLYQTVGFAQCMKGLQVADFQHAGVFLLFRWRAGVLTGR